MQTTAVDKQVAPASSLGPLSLSLQDLEAISWSDPKHTDPLMRFSMPPLWAALAGQHDSPGLHNCQASSHQAWYAVVAPSPLLSGATSALLCTHPALPRPLPRSPMPPHQVWVSTLSTTGLPQATLILTCFLICWHRRSVSAGPCCHHLGAKLCLGSLRDFPSPGGKRGLKSSRNPCSSLSLLSPRYRWKVRSWEVI